MYPETHVQRGAQWLDERVPDWETRIDLETLNIDDGTVCVLGQVFAADADQCGYISGYHFITKFVYSDHGEISPDEGQSYGFCASSTLHTTDVADGYRLTNEWKRVISERKMLAAV